MIDSLRTEVHHLDMKRTLLITIASLMVVAFSGIASAAPQQISNGLFKRVIRNGTSSNWSGYAVETNLKTPAKNAVTNVVGSWTVPKVTCTSATTYSSVWVGIDGYSDNTVEQTGTEQNCSRSKASYYAWYEMYPHAMVTANLSVTPGDSITASVQYSSANTYTLVLTDNTTGNSYTTSQRLSGASRESAEWIAEAPSSYSVLPLADFGTVNFTGSSATLNTTTGTISDTAWQNDDIQMLLNAKTPKATPSALSVGGSAFSVTWEHS